MWQRIRTGAILSVTMIAVLMAGKFFNGYYVYDIAIGFACTVGVWEMLHNTGFVKSKFITVVSMVYSVYIIFSFGTSSAFLKPYREMSAAVFVLLIFVYSMFDRHHSNATEPFIAFGGTMALGYAFGAFLSLLTANKESGIFYFALCIVFSWISDIGAYFVGSLCGKHKLCPDLSPKKTVEGAVGGVLSSVLISFAFSLLFNTFSHSFRADTLWITLLAVPLSVVGMIGDLLFSYIKRYCNIKDYGKLLPGHGGILDRFDSVLAVAPVMFALANLLDLVIPLS